MYVEVSERQTGKTRRMIEDMFKYLEAKEVYEACIVSSGSDYLDTLIPKVLKHPDYKESYEDRITYSTYMMIEDNVRNYVDEFDFIEEKNLFIDKTAYYCTTLEKYQEMSLNIIDTYRNRRYEKISYVLNNL